VEKQAGGFLKAMTSLILLYAPEAKTLDTRTEIFSPARAATCAGTIASTRHTPGTFKLCCWMVPLTGSSRLCFR
jgi:hypothetical protein